MLESAAPYVVAMSAMILAAASALVLIVVVGHFDPPESRSAL